MPENIKIYKIKDFVRKNESGELSRDRITKIIMEIATAATLYPGHNILIDSRKTTMSYDVNMIDIMKTTMELEKFKDVLKSKIANVIPEDENRISIAKKSESSIQIKGIKYKFFTDFEAAIEWLSDVT